MQWISFAIVCIYIAVSLGIGFVLNKRSSAYESTKSLFIAKKELGLPFIVALLFGEMIAGSSTVGSSTTAFSSGYTSIWINWGMALGVFLFLATVMKFYRQAGYYGSMTVPEAFSFRFGNKVRMVVVIIIMVVYGIVWSQQPVAASSVISPMTGANPVMVTWIVGILFIIMALVGIKGVAAMNIIHSSVMVVGMIIVAVLSVGKAGGLGAMLDSVPSYYTNLFYPNVSSVVSTALGSMFGFICSSTLVNTVYSAKNLKTAKTGTVIAALCVMVVALMPATIGIAGNVLTPQAEAKNILYAVASNIGTSFSTLISMAVMAAIFSTGPGVLLTLGSTMTQDLYVVLKPNSTMSQRLRFNAAAVIVIGIVATYLGLHSSSILSTISGAFQIRSVAAIVLIIGVYWKKVDNGSAFISILFGGIVAFVWFALGNPLGITPFWAGNIVGVVLIIVLSLSRNRGPVAADYQAYLDKVSKIPPEAL